MTEKNILKGLSQKEIEKILQEDLTRLGMTTFNIGLSPQAAIVISNYGDKFPWEHFKKWWMKRHFAVGGKQIYEYLSSSSGFMKGVDNNDG